MCGIAGILRIYPPGVTPPPLFDSIPESWLDTLDASIKHRGPDGQGRFRDRVLRADGCTADVALVHRRLSILDHAGGAQPMLTPPPKGEVPSLRGGGGEPPQAPLLFLGPPTAPVHYQTLLADPNLLAVVFNGCIYNHRELRKELQAAGHTFHTDHSDTEVLLHGWRQWQMELPSRLDGMFAFAIWDRAAGTLCLARDFAGEKPLYETIPNTGEMLIFGSTAASVWKTITAAGFGASHHMFRLNPWMMGDWIRFGGAALEPNSYGLHEVRPRMPRLVSSLQGRVACEIHLPSEDQMLPGRDSKHILTLDQLDHFLSESLKSRLDADVDVSCFLSGGVDSALLAYFARKHNPDIRAFTVRMPNVSFDESAAAAETAESLRLHHTVLDCQTNPAEDLPRLIEQLGLPFGDSSLLPTFWVSRTARDHAPVAISGDGGDELFGGYDRYRGATILRRFRSALRAAPLSPASIASNNRTWARVARLVDAARHGGYRDLVSIFPASLLATLTNEEPRCSNDPETNPLRRDFLEYLPDDILRKSDTASMAVALEVRSPFLSRGIVDAALKVPLSTLMPHGQRKGLLRQLARKYLPASIVDRPKMGFAIPIGEWFRSDYGGMKTLLLDHLNSTDAFPTDLLGLELNRTFIQQMLTEHMSKTRDHSQRLYMLLVLSIWCRWMKRLS